MLSLLCFATDIISTWSLQSMIMNQLGVITQVSTLTPLRFIELYFLARITNSTHGKWFTMKYFNFKRLYRSVILCRKCQWYHAVFYFMAYNVANFLNESSTSMNYPTTISDTLSSLYLQWMQLTKAYTSEVISMILYDLFRQNKLPVSKRRHLL